MRRVVDKYGWFEAIRGILNEVDAEGLLRRGTPEDEYDSEARTIVRSIEAGRKITPQHIHDIWLVWFGCGRYTGRDSPLEVGEMPMRPEFEQIAKLIRQRVTHKKSETTKAR